MRDIKSSLSKALSMTDIGLIMQFIGLELNQKYFWIVITRSRYIGDLIKRFHIASCKAASFPFLSGIILEEGDSTPLVDSTLYRQLIGSLLYLTHYHNPKHTNYFFLCIHIYISLSHNLFLKPYLLG